MKKLHFGPAGIPISTPDRNTINGIKHTKKLGLGSMELEFVRNINVSKAMAPKVKEAAKKEGIVLTCHGQYWVNLNAQDKAKLEASKKRVIDAATRCHEVGAWSLCYHMAFMMKMKKESVFNNVKQAVKSIIRTLDDNGIDVWLRPETAGKLVQFGDLDELIKLSKEFDQVLPCIDWAHHHARTNGKYNTYEEFKHILTQIEKHLGKKALSNMHMHAEGIAYGEKGEKHHLNLKDSDFNYMDLMKVLKEFKVKGVLTCESPNIEKDALLMKKYYDHL